MIVSMPFPVLQSSDWVAFDHRTLDPVSVAQHGLGGAGFSVAQGIANGG